MDGFDGELYLRLLGERALLSGGNQQPHGDPLVEQARALATVGAVAAPVARRVVEDYARVRALRGLGGPAHVGPPSAFGPPSATAQGPRRIALCHRVIRQPTGDLEIRYVILSQAETRLAIIFRSNAQVPPHVGGRPAAMPIGVTGVPSITVTDDYGNTVTSSEFSGGGTALQWRGSLTLRPALAPDTTWIELYGERVELGPSLGDRMVTIEDLTEADAVERYLAQCLAGTGFRSPQSRSLPEALEALTAAGLVDPADPAIAATHAVHEALTQVGRQLIPPPAWQQAPPPARRQAPPPAPPHVPPPPGATEPWRSLLARRGDTGGPAGTLFVGVATPVFDQVSAVLMDLTSTDAGFQCDVELSGPFEVGMAGGSTLDQVFVTFSALDDRGNVHLGRFGSWSGGGGIVSGTLGFWPALDPKATRLDIILTTDRARAVIAVPLTWDDAR
ncbi:MULTISPECIES: hypothetical protein [Pseudofrankia]|uniref:hypothetical protein n=1 Tax=Pseudofrankia TaxID=2994363 RepID=UPI000234B48D|nr:MULTISPECIES: hypothetical protein [Pseudofrankia]OHV38095.1 hypothetical protein BCD49_14020 [Pseudofrankia sp. EUN1h]